MNEKTIREYDRFIIRLPDGMRERLALRAKSSGRSMNSEIIDIVQQALDARDMEITTLYEESARLRAERSRIWGRLEELRERADIVREEIKTRQKAAGIYRFEKSDEYLEKLKTVKNEEELWALIAEHENEQPAEPE